MTKAKSANVPALRQKQIIKRWRDVGDALDAEGVTPLLLVQSVKKLLTAEKRVVQYGSGGRGDRESVMIPDANAVKNGIELSMEMMGLRSAKGFESEDTGGAENQLMVDAVIALTAEKVADGMSAEAVQSWLRTEEGIAAAIFKRDNIVNV